MSRVVHIDVDRFFDSNRYDNWGDGLKKAIEVGIDNGLDLLVERASVRMKAIMQGYGLANGELYSNLRIERVKDGLYITTHGHIDGNSTGGIDNYAMFVEYGTGIVGANSKPHPKLAEIGWEYDINEHGEEGWVYPTTSDNPTPYKWVGKDGEWYAWTKGQPARPFMYDTWRYLSSAWHPTMTGAINSAIKKWGDKYGE